MATNKVHPAANKGGAKSKHKLMNIIARARMVHGEHRYKQTAVGEETAISVDSEFGGTEPYTLATGHKSLIFTSICTQNRMCMHVRSAASGPAF